MFGHLLNLSGFVVQRGFVLLFPLLIILMGENLVLWLQRLFKLPESADRIPRACGAVLALLVYVTAAFFLKAAGLPWVIASVAPLAPAFFRKDTITRTFSRDYLQPGLNLVLWFFVVTALGTTLFQATDGIQTPWTNNYGDLTFHLGLITSFVFGDNVPPDYVVFSGQRLSYPFFVDFWSALQWWPIPDFKSLSFIFTVHWAFLWCLVYFLLNGNRYPLLPWALLFGGGTFAVLGHNSGEFIGKGYPWTSFLSTIWVTQRAALMGICVCLAVTRILVERYSPLLSGEKDETRAERKFLMLFAGLLLALSPLVHTHIFLTTGVVATLFLVFSAVMLRIAAGDGQRAAFNVPLGDMAFLFIVGLLSVIYLPWIAGKAGAGGEMWSFTGGWITGGDKNDLLNTVARSLIGWAQCGWLMFPLFLALAFVVGRWAWWLALAVVFIAANAVQLAFWDWDQIKIFLALYAIVLALWAWVPTSGRRAAMQRWLQLGLLLLMYPTLVEIMPLPFSQRAVCAFTPDDSKCERAADGTLNSSFASLFTKGDNFTVYSPTEVEAALKIRAKTPPDAVLQGAPDHNSPITLTGRKLFEGYEGTLSSHGLDYGARKELVEKPELLKTCPQKDAFREHASEICPAYLIWTDHERNFWKIQEPPMDGLREVLPGLLYQFAR